MPDAHILSIDNNSMSEEDAMKLFGDVRGVTEKTTALFLDTPAVVALRKFIFCHTLVEGLILQIIGPMRSKLATKQNIMAVVDHVAPGWAGSMVADSIKETKAKIARLEAIAAPALALVDEYRKSFGRALRREVQEGPAEFARDL